MRRAVRRRARDARDVYSETGPDILGVIGRSMARRSQRYQGKGCENNIPGDEMVLTEALAAGADASTTFARL